VVGNASSFILVIGGGAAIVAAVIWRERTGRRRLSRLTQQLDSTDPERRIASGQLAVSYGLTRAARTLLPRVEHEEDPAVRAGYAMAVAHRQWEPGGSKRVLALRMWAARELAAQGYDVNPFGPAFTRISDMGGPARPVPPAAAPVPAPSAAAASDNTVRTA
jgi:hypothetical protein